MLSVGKFQRITILLLIIASTSSFIEAQDQPYKIYETRPVILDGPYLVSPSNDGISIVWRTDTPCHSKIIWGEGNLLSQVFEPQEHGLVPVTTVHSVRLNGLIPGKTYSYQVQSTRVVKLKAYWPEKGLTVQSETFTFSLPGPGERVSFSFVTDSQHESVGRLNTNLDIVDWEKSDFLVHGGDALDWVANEDQLFDKFLKPVTERLDHAKPLIFVRGNHDMRGPYARNLYPYVPTGTGHFYFAFDSGPMHVIVLDTGEDKADETPVYAELNQFDAYREEEFRWLEEHSQNSSRMREAPFRVILMHNPAWGWVKDGEKWDQLANKSGIDLVIAGHRHRYSLTPPEAGKQEFHTVVVGQDQVGFVEADHSSLKVTVIDGSDETVGTLVLSRR